MTRTTTPLLLGGLALLVGGVLLPREWYFALTANPDLPLPPISGVTLFQLSLVVEGLALLWLAMASRTPGPRLPAPNLAPPAAPPVPEAISDRTALALLVVVTVAGLILRLWRLDTDLWLDEIAPLVTYRDRAPLEVWATYVASNNHLLNTLLVKASVAVFGEHEWSVRLPAAVFGVATIPVCYGAARLVFTRLNSLAVALLLAVSYHHIFFSQNARGYVAHVCFSLLASLLLCQGLRDGRGRTWVLYVIAMTLNSASLLISGFIFASHIVVALAALIVAWRGNRRSLEAGRPVVLALGASLFLSFQLYALVLPQAYVYMRSTYTQAGSGYSLLSGEFILELLRGMLAGVGSTVGWIVWPAMVVAIGVGAFGFMRLFARHWLLMACLILPGIFTIGVVLIGGLTVSPRYFLLGVPLALLVLTELLQAAAGLVLRLWGRGADPVSAQWLSFTAAAGLSGLLLVPLMPYYSVPKQAYVASAEYVRQQLRPADLLVVVHLAESGYRYYGPRIGLDEGRNTVYLRSRADLDAVVRSHTTGRILLVTTFPRIMRLEFPDLASAVDDRWAVARRFPGTIGDGDIAVWFPR